MLDEFTTLYEIWCEIPLPDFNKNHGRNFKKIVGRIIGTYLKLQKIQKKYFLFLLRAP